MAASFELAPSPPPAFYCPISLDLMTDPVTLSSGITYDRASIQSWLAAGNLTCPVTRQPLLPHPSFFVPNHTLLRIIRTWCYAHSEFEDSAAADESHFRIAAAAATSSMPDANRHIRLGRLCRDALYNLGLLDDINSMTSELIPHEKAPALLISLLSHYGSATCRGEPLAERICEEAAAALADFTLSSHHLSALSHPPLFNCLTHLLRGSHSEVAVRNSASLLAKLVSQHPSQRAFLQSLSSESLSTLACSLAQSLKNSNPSPFLTQHILHCLCLLCKSSRTALLSLTDATSATIAQAVLDQLLHIARQGRSMPNSLIISETALSLLHTLAACAEGRAAIASHAFAVPTIAKYLRRGVSEAAIESAVVVLWKLCRYSSEERVRRQAMEACVVSKLLWINMQASHCSARSKSKAGALVRLLAKCRHP